MKARVSAPVVVVAVMAAVMVAGCRKSDQPAPVSTAAPPAASSAAATSAPAAPGMPASAADTAAVTQAVREHLRDNKGINMSAMDMTVDSVTVDGDRAQANATFTVKGGGATMAMVYSLERHNDGWLVLKSQPSNGEFVHPPMDQVHSGAAVPGPPSSAPGTPDVTDFLKNQPPKKSN